MEINWQSWCVYSNNWLTFLHNSSSFYGIFTNFEDDEILPSHIGNMHLALYGVCFRSIVDIAITGSATALVFRNQAIPFGRYDWKMHVSMFGIPLVVLVIIEITNVVERQSNRYVFTSLFVAVVFSPLEFDI